MIETKVTVVNEHGLHARTAAKFVKKTKQFTCSITIQKGNSRANGKSLTGILGLGIGKGLEIYIIADGEDELAASKELKMLVETLSD
jgi:phosphocarrier protein HPr